MIIYISLLFLCAFVGNQMDKIVNRSSIKFICWMFIAFLALFLVAGLRFEVGKDYTDTYVFTYKLVQAHSKNIRMDIGLLIIYRIISFFEWNVQWIFIITSFIIAFLTCKSIKNQSKNIALSYWIYICGVFYFFSMNGVRQAIAIIIFYYSLTYIENKKLNKYMALNVIGCLFHASAILFLPLFFVLNKKISLKVKALAIFIMSVGGKFIIPICMNLLVHTKYAMYITNGAYMAQDTFNFSMILNMFFFLVYEIVLSKKEDVKSIIYSNIHFVGVIISLLATSLPLVIRMFVAFRFVEFLSVPNLIEVHFHNRYRKLITYGVYVMYFLYFIYAIAIQNGNDVLPYKSVLSLN